ncbi:hypothetical protein GPECTOR_3g205 [Gonium pectorale]|uniref:Uncharacterized protein n=1 Tax=Gonium pectorale TaxID=33097 RepID=A0A150GYR5_GONPE|nr:hypothetical protein GPECTOR_3g205 [Gonium pectorale]|eukprot:KXZ55046.1 hypothetical protein GPECTOR_3g205 [Gonium pectorale]
MNGSTSVCNVQVAEASQEALHHKRNAARLQTVTSIGRELVKDGDESHVLQAITRLSSELDLALANNADLAERLTSSDAIIAQQEGQIRRLTEELAALDSQLREAREHRDAQHRLSAELAAELQRLAAESALGPIMVLDKDGHLVPQEAPPPRSPSATAPATSQLEAQSTAVRVILADKAFGLGALCQAISKEPGSVQSVRAQLGECRALTESLRVEVHAVGLEARVLAAESALRSGASLLQGWNGLLTEVAAAEDGRLEPDIRLGLREELKTREDALHRAVLDLAAAAPPLLSGDPGYAAAHVALREAGNAMMDLALTLGDRVVDAPATRTRALAAEHLLLHRAEVISRFREVLAKTPGEIAEMIERLTAIIPDVQAMGPAIEEMLRCVQHFLAAGNEATVDVVALQGEVLMLRGLVRSKDMAIQALEACGVGIRTGSPTKRAQKMVPIEALHAAEKARDVAAGEKAALQTRMVDQRVRLVAAERAHANMVAAQEEQARVEKECREAIERMQAEVQTMTETHAAEIETMTANHVAEVTALTTTHAAEVVAIQTAHEDERRRARLAALEAAETRVKVLRRVMKEKTARWRENMAHAVLFFWRFRVRRQMEARERWRDFSTRLRANEEPDNPTYREILYGPRMTIARRLRLRNQDPSDLRAPSAMTGAQAWRGWAYVKRQMQKVDALTEAVPMFMENIGDRRRLERAWLAWRLWTAGATTERAQQAINDYEAAAAEANATKAAAESAVAKMEDELQQEHEKSAALEAEAAARANQLAQLGVDPNAPFGMSAADGYGHDRSAVAAEVGTQYLPHSHTVLTAGAQAPEHMAAANAVAAAQAAGLDVTVQPITGALQHQAGSGPDGAPPRVVGMPGGSMPGNMVTWGDLTGISMPPVAGPSQAAMDAIARRRSAPGIDASQDFGLDDGEDYYGAGGRSLSGGRMPPPGRDPLQQVSDNPRGRAGRRVAGVARPSGVATLAERAERLMRTVESISAGVADTAALLSPRTKVLQVAMEDATELETAQPQNSVRVLLDHVAGKKRPARDESRTRSGSGGTTTQQRAAPTKVPSSRALYSHIGSRLHESTVSTLAKQATGRPQERGPVNLASMPTPPLLPMAAPLTTLMPPSTNTPGPVTAAQIETIINGAPRIAYGRT